jgi:DNA mismatch endonuclease, patch repair protein
MRPFPRDHETSARLSLQRQRGTRAELLVGKQLREMGSCYRKNVRTLTGSPDFANARRRWAVFVNGCFWHHHTNCRRATTPRTNEQFWLAKFAANRKRDARAVRELRMRGFRVVIVWECDCDVEITLRKVFEPRRVQP